MSCRGPKRAQGSGAPIRLHLVQDARSSVFAQKLSSVLNKVISHNWKWPIKLESSGPDISGSISRLISRLAENNDAVILLSDQVVGERHEHSADKRGLAWELRKQALTHRAIIYIIAVAQQGLAIPHLVDNTISEDANEEAICHHLVKAFRSILYRCPPTKSLMDPAESVQVKMVDSFDELKESLRLRHRIYKLLGYSHEIASEADGCVDLDPYDAAALHFVAIASSGDLRTVIGTARLVCYSFDSLSGSILGNSASFPEWRRAVAEWLATRSASLRSEVFSSEGMAGLPVLETFDIVTLTESLNISCARLGEVGRVVVAEKFRGLGISRLLVRACLAAASDLGLGQLLLDCIPQHMPIYRKCGFKQVSGAAPHEDIRVGQFATLMHLDLDNEIADESVMMARRDIATIKSFRTGTMPFGGLCLCTHADCWQSGIYGRRGASDCPLREKFKLGRRVR